MPVPSEGWDTETPDQELPPTRARQFDNWVTQGVAIAIRKGTNSHVTGIGSAVQTLMPYNAGASSALFAAAASSIYNVTSPGAVGAAVVTGLSTARISFTNFSTSGGFFLYCVNGSDAPRYWNGTSWTTPTLTTSTYSPSSISFVFNYKERLYFIYKNTLTFGYLATQAVAGPVSDFPLGAVVNYGGRLVAGGSLSRDGASGLADFAVFVTSEGEVIVYAGANPGDATNWSLVGSYYVGEPVGDRPLVDTGGDLAVITKNGLLSIGTIMGGQFGSKADLMGRVATPFKQALANGQSYNGWEGMLVPTENLVLVNAPYGSSNAYQYTRNILNGAIGRFTGWNFATFENFLGEVYAGDFSGTIFKCFQEYDDNGSDITASAKTGWSSMRNPGVKVFQEIRPIVTTNTAAAFRMVARTDFYDDGPALPSWPAVTVTNALIWDSGNWDEKYWGGLDAATRAWRSISGEGHHLSLVYEARSNQSPYTLNGFDLRYDRAGQT